MRARERGQRTWRFGKGEKVARGYSAKSIFMSPAMTDPAFASSAAVIVRILIVLQSLNCSGSKRTDEQK